VNRFEMLWRTEAILQSRGVGAEVKFPGYIDIKDHDHIYSPGRPRCDGSKAKRPSVARPLTDKLDSLEDNLRCKLHVEGLAGPDAWGAVEVADGVTD